MVNPPPSTHFSVTAPANVTSGAAFNFTVTALDASNHVATAYAGTVHFTSSDGTATLPSNATLINGTGTFSATFRTTGNQSITATDTPNGSLTGTSNLVLVSPPPTTHFVVTAPASATNGAAFNFTVTALDASNNVTTAYAGTVHFTSSDAAATLPANATLTNGSASFSATLRIAGNQTLTATDTLNVSLTGTSNLILVSAPPATHLVLSTPASTTSGTPFTFTVTALDATNAVATGYTGTVHFSSTDPSATLPANAMLTSGSGTFSTTLRTLGNQTLTATDTVNAAVTGTSNVILVRPALVSITLTPNPASVMVGLTRQLTATGHYSDGSTQNLTGSATWSSSNSTIASVSNASGTRGRVTGKIPNAQVTITAMYQSIPGRVTLTVTKAFSSVSITSQTPNPSLVSQAVTVSFQVRPTSGNTLTPSGTVTVRASTGESCTGLAPSGSCRLTFFTIGNRTITASYAGDTYFNSAGTSGGIQQVGDFQVAVSPTSQTITFVSGSRLTAQYNFWLAAVGSFSGPLSLSCTLGGGPCPMSPASVTLGIGGTAQAIATATVAQAGGANPRGTYTVTLSATSATGLTHSVTATLVVQ
jgi:hypothetical protein